ncbi:MAG: hypothetical protein JKY37_20450 [Nannocystaceae bacterium]|nr:hypothetical protein [Nannocystaceae bacterium]
MNARVPRLVLATIVVGLVLVGLHALGVRRSTVVMSGVVGSPTEVLLALVYICCWFTTVLITPIVLLAWGLLRLDRRLRPASR